MVFVFFWVANCTTSFCPTKRRRPPFPLFLILLRVLSFMSQGKWKLSCKNQHCKQVSGELLHTSQEKEWHTPRALKGTEMSHSRVGILCSPHCKHHDLGCSCKGIFKTAPCQRWWATSVQSWEMIAGGWCSGVGRISSIISSPELNSSPPFESCYCKAGYPIALGKGKSKLRGHKSIIHLYLGRVFCISVQGSMTSKRVVCAWLMFTVFQNWGEIWPQIPEV